MMDLGPLELWGATFFDWGALSDTLRDFNRRSFRGSTGVGLRLLLYGRVPIRLDYGVKLNPRCRQYAANYEACLEEERPPESWTLISSTPLSGKLAPSGTESIRVFADILDVDFTLALRFKHSTLDRLTKPLHQFPQLTAWWNLKGTHQGFTEAFGKSRLLGIFRLDVRNTLLQFCQLPTQFVRFALRFVVKSAFENIIRRGR